MAAALPPRYVEFKEQIRTEMFTIKQKMGSLRQVHGRAVLTSFDDTDSTEAEIEVLTQDITRLFRKVEARLQQFTAGPAAGEADEKVWHFKSTMLALTVLKPCLHAALDALQTLYAQACLSDVMRIQCWCSAVLNSLLDCVKHHPLMARDAEHDY